MVCKGEPNVVQTFQMWANEERGGKSTLLPARTSRSVCDPDLSQCSVWWHSLLTATFSGLNISQGCLGPMAGWESPGKLAPLLLASLPRLGREKPGDFEGLTTFAHSILTFPLYSFHPTPTLALLESFNLFASRISS